MKLSKKKSDEDAKISTGAPGTLNCQRFEAAGFTSNQSLAEIRSQSTNRSKVE